MRKVKIDVTMDTSLIKKLDNIEVGESKDLARSAKISLMVEWYIKEYEEGKE